MDGRADGILGIIALCDSGEIELVSSEALLYEAKRNPNPVRKQHALAVLEMASITVQINDIIEQRSRLFVETGIKPLDALHLATAEVAEVDYLCTCDDRFLKKAQLRNDLSIKVVSPVTLIEELNL